MNNNELNMFLSKSGIVEKNKSIHLGIFIEPFLSHILDGKKKWESRFSVNRCAPYNKVKNGDYLLIKKSGGPILGIVEITKVIYFELDKGSFDVIRKNYSELLCIEDPLFWETKKDASYATLMKLSSIRKLNPIDFIKQDRRGWVVLENRTNQLKLSL